MGTYCSCILGDGAAVGAVVSILRDGPIVEPSVGTLGDGSTVGALFGDGSVVDFTLEFMAFGEDLVPEHWWALIQAVPRVAVLELIFLALMQ